MKEYFVGIDVGSSYTKGVIVDEHSIIIGKFLCKTKPNMSYAANICFSDLCQQSGLNRELTHVTAIGYGRKVVEFADSTALDLICVAKAINHINKKVRTIVEVGGQDAKILRIDGKGNVLDFAMNDKCSAGTGRFLELMADVLDIEFEDLAKLSMNSTEQLTISSTCSVFAQSEVISLLSYGKKREDIVKAIHKAISSRIYDLILQVDIEDAVCMVGGVALDNALTLELEEMLGKKLIVPDQPQFIGAYGAALITLCAQKKGRLVAISR